MRSFIAASCCAIVGLEVLIGVPVAVCLGFLCFGSTVSNTYVAEAQYPQPVYAPVPYIPSALPSGTPMPTFDPYACPPPLPACAPAPMPRPSGGYEAPQSNLPTTKVAAAGVPLVPPAADSTVPPERQSPAVEATDSPADQQTVAGAGAIFRLTIGDAEQLVARVCSDETCPEATAKSEHGELAELATSIRQTTHLLYRHAERCEEAGDFDEADGIRALARDLRQEVERLTHSTEGVPLLSEAPRDVLPSGVSVGPPPRG